MKRTILAFLCISVVAVAAAADKKSTQHHSADAIYVNGNVYVSSRQIVTGATRIEDAQQKSGGAIQPITVTKPRPTAFAVKDGKFVAVGTDNEVQAFKGKQTVVVDLHGKFVMPGFNDAHVHLGDGGMQMLTVNLVGTKSLAEMKQRIAEYVRTAGPGQWILGGGWDHTKWAEQKLPTKTDLDAVTAGHPAFLDRADGHIAIANSAALAAAHIDKSTATPEGGRIDHDVKGEPTGIIGESAKELVGKVIPPPTPSQRRKGIELALADAAKWGITSLQDNSPWDDFLVYEELESEGKLTARIAEWLPFRESVSVLSEHRSHHAASDPMLHTTMLKGFMDGSLGSRTAALQKPYSDEPDNKGLPQFDQGALNHLASERVGAGFQLGFHAIGDEGVEMALEAFADAQRFARDHNAGGRDIHDLRFRIEHSQVLSQDQFARYRELGVIASMQPNHLLTDMYWALDRLGTERARYSYAWREFLDTGVPLAFGTDYPVEPITPFRGVYAAVTRQNEEGTRDYFPTERLTIEEALAAYTEGSAYAQFEENAKGHIETGMDADFVVLDRDITDVRAHDILGTQVLRTVVAGKTVYEAK